MSRFLLLPGNNTLSHVAKCLAIRQVLLARGHEVHLAISPRRVSFLSGLGIRPLHTLPDLGDGDGSPAPTLGWFRPRRVIACVEAEVTLIRQLRPDRVLGVFRFTGAISAGLSDVPYDSLVCGAMTRVCNETLGFNADEAGADEQAAALAFFRSAGARRMAPALAHFGLTGIDDLWQLLEAERTFLWDTPRFQPLVPQHHLTHVGPLQWNVWPDSDVDPRALDRLQPPIALLAFGTGGADTLLLRRLVTTLWQLGFSVAMALGGQTRSDWMQASTRLAVFDYLPSDIILPRVALVVCHGGQMLVFESLRRRLPIMVLPTQPEQAQNGRCLERLGCGQRLFRGVVFDGASDSVMRALAHRSNQDLAEATTALLSRPGLHDALRDFASDLGRYDGAVRMAETLEAAA